MHMSYRSRQFEAGLFRGLGYRLASFIAQIIRGLFG